MKKKILPLVTLLLSGTTFFAAMTMAMAQPVYEIQGTGEISSYDGQQVTTEGVVTAVFQKTNSLDGFYIQDTLGDGNDNTSDAIFIYNNTPVAVGDYVQITGTVGEYNSQTQISNASVSILASNRKVPFIRKNFPLDFQGSREAMEGMAFILPHTMYIINANDQTRYGQVHLASKLLRAPTDQALPLSAEYNDILYWNSIDDIILDDASTRSNPTPTPYTDADGSMRTSRHCDSLYCIMGQQGNTYLLYPAVEPVFYGNPRTAAPDETLLGNYNLKVCGFNIEHFGNSSELQKSRIVKAVMTIDADIYGFCEVLQDNTVIKALVDAMNEAKGSDVYTYLPLHTSSSTYEVVQVVYRTDRVAPYKGSFKISTGVQNRKFIQAFSINGSSEVFVFSINHFKAKSGTGTGANADQGDGQGVFNYNRTLEAQALLSKLNELNYYYGTQRMLIMGDLNSFHFEDPIMVFRRAGYTNLTNYFDSNSYSYHYGSHVEYLDYSLATDSLAKLATGATVWHINTDEPSSLSYERSSSTDIYRCSDHDPVIVGLNFPNISTPVEQTQEKPRFVIFPNPATDNVSVFSAHSVKDISIFSMSGNNVLHRTVNDNEVTLNISSFAPGLYLIKITTEDGKTLVQKLQKIK
ncbi:MAG: ExeM/NucH family extracellular endonuclease [Bacteroidales bacterium]|jgi:predicted extracellular nuclease|nr:ExeM/NucH family extracellular endonuclease [Bacteroidales bacterium]